MRRRLPLILAAMAVTISLGSAYLLTAPAKYTATATLVIDPRKAQDFQEPGRTDRGLDTGTVETQVQILKSESISLAVINELHLTTDPEFTGSAGGPLGAVINVVADLFGPAASQSGLPHRVLETFERNRTVKRIGTTYAIAISFRSLSPQKAATIANAIADAYIVDQLEAKYQTTRRAGGWMQERLDGLRAQASEAERAVVEYKERNNIVNVGGRLMSEQRIGEINSQLVIARASAAEAKARLERVKEIIKDGIPDESISDALKNPTIIKLRGQYVDLASREAMWSAKYGASHLATVNLRNQLTEIKNNIRQELQRIQQVYQSDYDIALAREESIRSSLDSAVTETQATNQAQVQLKELESKAQTYRSMYDSFLQRYMETAQQQSFPISEARPVSPASAPLKKSDPNSLLVMAIAAAGGLALGFGLAYLRELNDKAVRTTRQVDELLDTRRIVVVPRIKISRKDVAARMSAACAQVRAGKGGVVPLPSANPLLSEVVDQPFSRFAESMRLLKVFADERPRADKVIAVTATMEGDGKSTIAANFARLIAHAGGKVVLVDADLRNPSLSRALTPNAEHGLIDVLFDKVALPDALRRDAATELMFLPTGNTSELSHPNEVMASAPMKAFVEKLRASYDYVIIDLPPIAPIADVRAAASLIDSYVFVVEWGRTRIDVIKHNLAMAGIVSDKVLGVVVNKADTAALSSYERHHSDRLYGSYYGKARAS